MAGRFLLGGFCNGSLGVALGGAYRVWFVRGVVWAERTLHTFLPPLSASKNGHGKRG